MANGRDDGSLVVVRNATMNPDYAHDIALPGMNIASQAKR
jgi:hypothetical protein